MKKSIVLVVLIFLRFSLSAQQVFIGGMGVYVNEDIHDKSELRGYSSHYKFTSDYGFGIVMDIGLSERGLLRSSFFRNKVDFKYDIEYFALNSSFGNSTEHKILTNSLAVDYFWLLNTDSRINFLIGSGIRVNILELVDSHGEGYRTELVEYVTVSGDTILAPGAVEWSYSSKNNSQLYKTNLQVNLALQVRTKLSERVFVFICPSAVLGVSSLIKGEGIQPASSRGFQVSMGVIVFLKKNS